jgi:small subunit ribosomal protein S2
MAVVTLRELLEAGIHFGHQTRRWNPKMSRYIFGQRNGIYIIDLQKTLRQVHKAYGKVRDAVAAGGTVLFVGTKKQSREPVEREAKRCGMYYVNNRWLGGTLTNFETIQRSVRNLISLEGIEESGKAQGLTKKEITRMRRERTKLEKNLSGIKTMDRLPQVMFVIDTKKEAIAVREAERLGILCIGVVDTNADPDVVPIPVPGNDDAIRAVGLFCKIMADAVIEGRALAGKRQPAEDRRGAPRVRRIGAVGHVTEAESEDISARVAAQEAQQELAVEADADAADEIEELEGEDE